VLRGFDLSIALQEGR